MKRLFTSLLLLSTFAFAAPPQPIGLPVYHAHGEALRAMFFDTHTRGGSGGSSLAALSDNGTVVTSTEPLVLPVGAVALASNSLQFGGNFGIYSPGANTVRLSNGSDRIELSIQGITVASNGANQYAVGATVASPDTWLRRRAAASWMLGAADLNGSPVAQTLGVQNAITGTDLPGAAAFTLAAPLGTGAGAGSSIQLQRAQMTGTGTTAQTGVAAIVVCESKTLSNTSATAQTLANIALASNSAGGAAGFITVTATDGTNFDSETQSFNVSYVNKAGTGTVGTPAITTSSAANNSGSATIGMTATFSGGVLSIKTTPVFTTIVPTTVTAYLELQNHGAGAVTCQ